MHARTVPINAIVRDRTVSGLPACLVLATVRDLPSYYSGAMLSSKDTPPRASTPEEGTGYELRPIVGKGEGVFTTQSFRRKELVMRGVILQSGIKNHSHASQIGENEFVLHAGLMSKVNHSCDPNCGIRVNSTGAHDFVAFRDIEFGEELTFDYAMRNDVVEIFPPDCACGARNCRGRIDGWKTLPEDTKRAYDGFVAPYLLEIDSKNARDNSA